MKLILLIILTSSICFGADFYYKYDASGNRELRATINPYKISVEGDFDSEATTDSLLSNSVKIYPNPTDGKIKIEVGKNIESKNIKIISLEGKELFNIPSKLINEIDLSL